MPYNINNINININNININININNINVARKFQFRSLIP